MWREIGNRTIRLRSSSFAATSLHLAGSVRCRVTEFDGAQGRDRTTDTAIFSRMLYQLSYLGAPFRLAAGLIGRASAPVQLARGRRIRRRSAPRRFRRKRARLATQPAGQLCPSLSASEINVIRGRRRSGQAGIGPL